MQRGYIPLLFFCFQLYIEQNKKAIVRRMGANSISLLNALKVIPQIKVDRNNLEQLILQRLYNYIYMHACMHAANASLWSECASINWCQPTCASKCI